MVRIRTKRISKNEKEQFFFPVGKVNTLMIYPLSFEEYLFNTNPNLLSIIRSSYKNMVPLEKPFHELALNLLYQYLLLGGLPDVQQTYIDTNSFLEARKVMQEIYNDYLDDMELYQTSEISIARTRKMFDSIFLQLNKENKNMKFSQLEEKSKRRDFESPIFWLTTAGLAYQCYCIKERVSLPLSPENESLFKMYINDCGLLAMQSGINMSVFINPLQQNTLSGLFFENYVADEFTAKKIPLFYWKGKDSNEFEFITEINGKAVPIDVKKNRGKLSSLPAFQNHNPHGLAIKISANSLGYAQNDHILTVPLYMTFILAEDIANQTMNIE